MSILHSIRLAARKLGLEFHRYNTAQSLDARFFSMLKLHKVDLIIDVGANDGGYGNYLRTGRYAGPIVSFEPLNDAYESLRARAAGDRFWTVAPKSALGAVADTVEINVAGNSKSSSLLPMMQSHLNAAPHTATIGHQSVLVRRLDDVDIPELKAARSALLKIDTQGYEMQVLSGSSETLERCIGLQLEMSLLPLYEGQVLYRQLIDWLDCRGFDLWALLPGFSDLKTGRMMQMDGIFFKR